MSRNRNDEKGIVVLMGLVFVISVGVTYIYFRHLFRRAKLSVYSKIIVFIVYVVSYGILFNAARSAFDYHESGLAFVFFIYFLALLAVPICFIAEGVCWIIEKIYDVATMKDFYASYLMLLEETRQELLVTYAEVQRPILDYLLSVPYVLEYPGYTEAKKQIVGLQYDIGLKTDILEFVSEHPETSLEVVEALSKNNLILGMNTDEVAFLRGDPNEIDQEEITANHRKIRFVYGYTRGHKDYIYFKDGIVNKIQGATL